MRSLQTHEDYLRAAFAEIERHWVPGLLARIPEAEWVPINDRLERFLLQWKGDKVGAVTLWLARWRELIKKHERAEPMKAGDGLQKSLLPGLSGPGDSTSARNQRNQF